MVFNFIILAYLNVFIVYPVNGSRIEQTARLALILLHVAEALQDALSLVVTCASNAVVLADSGLLELI
jgi:hypothetical protein